ncbi:MAG TPA: tRNA (guanosine(37)-N1)-methyltransferase TrmD [Chloroflexota bacterium]|jgi:tRNA (guanine37-N1)-methyltransferase|nr:tRNA (guanosine(37)-N1)-methyltransferase TrmD [Chloroflexota bacterium]
MSLLRVDIVTLFPGMFQGWLECGGVGRAIDRGLLRVDLIDLRQFGLGRHLQVDDTPFGGGAGMILRPEPLFAAVESIADLGSGPVILLSPRGRRFSQAIAGELATGSRLTLIAGHYEGVDERVSEHLATDEISVGDYVLSGGEPAAMVIVDAVARLLPGAIDEQSTVEESFISGGGLEYPHYTRPSTFRGWDVPEVLTSGNHAKIAAWRREQAGERTRSTRPDLMNR